MASIGDHGQPNEAVNVEHRIKRDMAEMLGLAKGILFDGIVNEEETMSLMTWADEHPDVVTGWPGNVLYRRLRKIFSDGYASNEEREDLKELLTEMVGSEGGSVGGETASTGLPFNEPVAPIEITDRTFVFTGRFAYGARSACEEAVRRIGGWVEPRVTQHTDYLVIGTFASRDWLQTSYGLKILKAVEYREKHGVPVIISEQHWVAHL
ncbi:MAG: BRCT domain-containing protein [Longimicrobiales bacterium]|nr:BRCT domain-containing protein [Longimicrobiales bacterium]